MSSSCLPQYLSHCFSSARVPSQAFECHDLPKDEMGPQLIQPSCFIPAFNFHSELTLEWLPDFETRQFIVQVGSVRVGGRLPDDGDVRLRDGLSDRRLHAGRHGWVGGHNCRHALSAATLCQRRNSVRKKLTLHVYQPQLGGQNLATRGEKWMKSMRAKEVGSLEFYVLATL